MSEPFVGEIRMFAGNFAPRGWAFCDGQLLAVSQNDALFSLLGTVYGGDGRTTFGLPDVRGRIPLHQGTGPGLSPRRLGAKGGAEKVTLTVNQIPSHNHNITVSDQPSVEKTPVGTQLGVPISASGAPRPFYGTEGSSNLGSSAFTTEGGSRAHTNLMPFLCINFIIALVGIYPSRN